MMHEQSLLGARQPPQPPPGRPPDIPLHSHLFMLGGDGSLCLGLQQKGTNSPT